MITTFGRTGQAIGLILSALPLAGLASDNIGYFGIFAAQIAGIFIAIYKTRSERRRDDRNEAAAEKRHARDRSEAAADAQLVRADIARRAAGIERRVADNTQITEKTLDAVEKK